MPGSPQPSPGGSRASLEQALADLQVWREKKARVMECATSTLPELQRLQRTSDELHSSVGSLDRAALSLAGSPPPPPAPAVARQPGPRTPRTAPAGRQPYDATPSTARSSASSAASEPRSNSPAQRARSPPAEPGLGAARRERPPQHDASSGLAHDVSALLQEVAALRDSQEATQKELLALRHTVAGMTGRTGHSAVTQRGLMWLVFAATCFLAAVLVSVSAGFSGSPIATAPVAVVLGAMGWRRLAGSNEAG